MTTLVLLNNRVLAADKRTTLGTGEIYDGSNKISFPRQGVVTALAGDCIAIDHLLVNVAWDSIDMDSTGCYTLLEDGLPDDSSCSGIVIIKDQGAFMVQDNTLVRHYGDPNIIVGGSGGFIIKVATMSRPQEEGESDKDYLAFLFGIAGSLDPASCKEFDYFDVSDWAGESWLDSIEFKG